MRILLVSHGLPPENVGGVEQHVDGLAKALVAAGHDVEIFARGDLPNLDQGRFECTHDGNPRITRCAYRWENTNSLEAMHRSEPMADAIGQFVRERRAQGVTFDVAHVHHLTGMSIDALQTLRNESVPTVMTLHDYWLFCPRGQMFNHDGEICEAAPVERCTRCLQKTFPFWMKEGPRDKVRAMQQRARLALKLPQRLIVPSERAAPPFLDLGVERGRIAVVENGVDVDRLELLPRPTGGKALRIGYFGTLIPSKGLHVLIEAVQRLPVGSVELHIHGNAVPYHGDHGYLTRCFSRLRPDDAITYHGPYSLEDMPARIETIDVLAAPALWHEAFGLTVREALAASRPVLVSRVGGLQDAIEDNEQGLVLPPGDVDAWALAIRRLHFDRAEFSRLAAAARGLARGFAPMAAELAGIYAEVAGA